MTFNALKYVEELINAGVSDQQAKAHIKVLQETIESNLATKRDMADIKRDIIDARRDIKESEQRIKIWIGSVIVITLSVLVALSKLNII